MLSAMTVEPVLLSWFVARQIRSGDHLRHWWFVLLAGIAGSVPAFVLGIRLLR